MPHPFTGINQSSLTMYKLIKTTWHGNTERKSSVSSVCTIKARASGLGRWGISQSTSKVYKCISFPTGTGSGKHAQSVITQMSTLCQLIHAI